MVFKLLCSRNFLFVFFFLFCLLFSFPLSSAINVVNSDDWQSVHSVALYSALNNEDFVFVNSNDSSDLFLRLPKEGSVSVFESDWPIISDIDSVIVDSSYLVVSDFQKSSSFNLDFAVEFDKFILVSEDYFRILPSLIPFAKDNSAWILLVNSDNVDDVKSVIDGSEFVVAVGPFKNSVLDVLDKSSFSAWINSGDVFSDSQFIASFFDDISFVILADGSVLESEFYLSDSPVLLTGSSTLLPSVFNFLDLNEVDSVLLVGTDLAGVGEVLRIQSNKSISVFVKFGKSYANDLGSIFGLELFRLPVPDYDLKVSSVFFDSNSNDLVVNYFNPGNSPVYGFSSISVFDSVSGSNVFDVSDSSAFIVGANENFPVYYSASDLGIFSNSDLSAKFDTIFGLSANSLDSILVSDSGFFDPVVFSVSLSSFESFDGVSVVSLTYYEGVDKLVLKISNPLESRLHYSVRLRDVVVDGLASDFISSGIIDDFASKEVSFPVSFSVSDLGANSEVFVNVATGLSPNNILGSSSSSVVLRHSFRFSGIIGFLLYGEDFSVSLIDIGIFLIIFGLSALLGFGAKKFAKE